MFLKAVQVELALRYESQVVTDYHHFPPQRVASVAVPFLRKVRNCYLNKSSIKGFYKGEDSSWKPEVLPEFTTIEFTNGDKMSIEGPPELFALQYVENLKQGHI